MAQGVMYKLIDSESRDNITNIQTEVREQAIAGKEVLVNPLALEMRTTPVL